MKTRSLNGWKRLWIVYSVACLLVTFVVVFRMWPTIDSPKDYNLYLRDLSDTTREEIDPMDHRVGMLKPIFDWITIECPNGARVKIPEAIKLERRDAIAKEYAMVVNKIVTEKRT